MDNEDDYGDNIPNEDEYGDNIPDNEALMALLEMTDDWNDDRFQQSLIFDNNMNTGNLFAYDHELALQHFLHFQQHHDNDTNMRNDSNIFFTNTNPSTSNNPSHARRRRVRLIHPANNHHHHPRAAMARYLRHAHNPPNMNTSNIPQPDLRNYDLSMAWHPNDDVACSSASSSSRAPSQPSMAMLEPVIPNCSFSSLSSPSFSPDLLTTVPWPWNTDVMFHVFDKLGVHNTASVVSTRHVCKLWHVTVAAWLSHTHRCCLRRSNTANLISLKLHNVQELKLDTCQLEDSSRLTGLLTSLPLLSTVSLCSPQHTRLDGLWTALAHCSRLTHITIRGATEIGAGMGGNVQPSQQQHQQQQQHLQQHHHHHQHQHQQLNWTLATMTAAAAFAPGPLHHYALPPHFLPAPPQIVAHEAFSTHPLLPATTAAAGQVPPATPLPFVPSSTCFFLSVLHPTHPLSHIDLSNTLRLGFNGLVALANALRFCENLKTVILSNCGILYPSSSNSGTVSSFSHSLLQQIQHKPLTALLCGRSQITHLDLSSNTLGPEGAQDLLEAITPTDQQPNLSSSSSSSAPAAASSSSHVLGSSAYTSLTHLDLSSTNYLVWMDPMRQLMRQLPLLPCLTSLSVSGCGCDDTVTELFASLWNPRTRIARLNVGCTMQNSLTVQHVGRALMRNSSITELNLSNQRFGPLAVSDLQVLTEALIVNRSIRHLNLSSFLLGDTGASLVAEALKYNRSLATINLAHNSLSDFGGCCVADVLAHNTALQSVTLGVTINLCRLDTHPAATPLDPGIRLESLGNAEIAVLAGILERDKHTTSLNLTMKCTKQIFQRLSTSLQSNTTLTHLDLSHNHLFSEEDTALMLGLLLSENTALTHLNLRGNTIWSTAAKHIRSGILSNPNLPLKILNLQMNYLSDTCKAEMLELVELHDSLVEVLV